VNKRSAKIPTSKMDMFHSSSMLHGYYRQWCTINCCSATASGRLYVLFGMVSSSYQ